MLSSLTSLGLSGIEPFIIQVEVSMTRAMPGFDIVGLPDAAVKESRDRIRSALVSCGFCFPAEKVTVNLAPADIKKEGSIYDLPILVGLLSAMGEIEYTLDGMAFLGELSLSGEIRKISGVLPMLIDAGKMGVKQAFIPYDNAAEASAIQDISVYAVKNISELIGFLKHKSELTLVGAIKFEDVPTPELPDFCDVKGQEAAKRALEIAAAGGHNVLLIGPPGTGKSMLAKRLPSILPEMSVQESVESTKIYSACGTLPPGVPLMKTRPFRAPHHTVSAAGLCGGGSIPRPGDITLAHNGVLFLDELPEFSRPAMEAMRQPLEDGELTISRAKLRVTFPSRFMLIAAMNPCHCGYFGHPTKSCICTPAKVSAYLSKISGPLLDRLDLHVEVLPVGYDQLSSPAPSESSTEIKKRVVQARQRQSSRFADTPVLCNAMIPPNKLSEYCTLSEPADKMLAKVFEKLGLSGRAYDRILKVARTIADLSESDIIEVNHLSEAVQYRSLDRKYWNR